jgi:hypothetical protein
MWTLAFGYHEDRTPTHGHPATRWRSQKWKMLTSSVASKIGGTPARLVRSILRLVSHIPPGCGGLVVQR